MEESYKFEQNGTIYGPVAVGNKSQAVVRGDYDATGSIANQSYDRNTLEQELQQLKTHIESLESSLENDIAVGELAKAQVAIQNNADTKTIATHLKACGAWVLNVAKDIGVRLIANIISDDIKHK